jgi:hypothetical protein
MYLAGSDSNDDDGSTDGEYDDPEDAMEVDPSKTQFHFRFYTCIIGLYNCHVM